MGTLSRRAVLLGGCAAAFHCSRRDGGPSGATAHPSTPRREQTPALVEGGRGTTKLLEWSFPDQEPERAAVVVPAWEGPNARFPTVVALHGRGEALKPPSDGAMGWPRDYELVRAVRRLCAPPLTKDDFEDLIDDRALAAENEVLARTPYRGLIAACPYVPDLDLRRLGPIDAFGRFLLDVLVPRVRAEAPAVPSPEATGIDGVSLGGRSPCTSVSRTPSTSEPWVRFSRRSWSTTSPCGPNAPWPPAGATRGSSFAC